MADLRATVATAMSLTAASRLIAVDAADLVGDVDRLPVYAAVDLRPTGAPRSVVADPSRLPFVAALADLVVARLARTGDPHARLREIWRILAPAGTLVAVVPLPTGNGITHLVLRQIVRRRLARHLAAAMFDAASWQVAERHLVVRAGKRDGLAPPQRVAAAAQRPVHASAALRQDEHRLIGEEVR